jgi:hypothetical protein
MHAYTNQRGSRALVVCLFQYSAQCVYAYMLTYIHAYIRV